MNSYEKLSNKIEAQHDALRRAMDASPFFSKDIKVIVGGKTYHPDSVEVTQNSYEVPTVRIEFAMNPYPNSLNYISKLTAGQIPHIDNVIFNPPATIVFWNDGTKTVVKAQEDETFDPEKGLAMAIAKKSLGNKGNYFNQIKKWTENFEDPRSEFLNKEFHLGTTHLDIEQSVRDTYISMDKLAQLAKRISDTWTKKGGCTND